MWCCHSCRKHRCCALGDTADAETNTWVLGAKENGQISYSPSRPDFVFPGNILLQPVHNYMIGTHPVYISATSAYKPIHSQKSITQIKNHTYAHITFHIRPAHSSIHWPRSLVRICLTAFDSNELGFEIVRISPSGEDAMVMTYTNMHPCMHVLKSVCVNARIRACVYWCTCGGGLILIYITEVLCWE